MQQMRDFVIAAIWLAITAYSLTLAQSNSTAANSTNSDGDKQMIAAASSGYAKYQVAPQHGRNDFYSAHPAYPKQHSSKPEYKEQVYIDAKYNNEAPKYEVPIQLVKNYDDYSKHNIESKYKEPVKYEQPQQYYAPSQQKIYGPPSAPPAYNGGADYNEPPQYAEKQQSDSQPFYPPIYPQQKSDDDGAYEDLKQQSYPSASPYDNSDGDEKLDDHDAQPTCAKKLQTTFCLEDYYYPQKEILYAIDSNQEAFAKLYAEAPHNAYREHSGDYDEDDLYAKGYSLAKDPYSLYLTAQVCDSYVQERAKLKRARNSDGKWQIVVQAHGYEQSVRLESCKSSHDCCNFVDQHYDSECVQKHAFQRLVVFDQWNKYNPFKIDIFKLPLCCSCKLNPYSSKDGRKCNKRGYADDNVALAPLPIQLQQELPLKNDKPVVTYETSGRYPPGPPPAPQYASPEPIPLHYAAQPEAETYHGALYQKPTGKQIFILPAVEHNQRQPKNINGGYESG